MPTGHRLTDRQIGLIRRLYEEARWLAVEDIAGIAGITRATVLNHARRGGWRRRGHTGIQFQPRLHEAPALAATAAEPAAMANTKSALKAARQTERNTVRNKGVKTRLKTLRKKFMTAVTAGDKDAVAQSGSEYASAMDRATKSGVVHRNAAARAKSHVSKALAS